MSFFSLHAYIKYCSFRNRDVRFFHRFQIIQKLYTDSYFIELINNIQKNKYNLPYGGDKFEITWDFDHHNVFLDKNIYVETNMYGEKKYKFKPNLKVMDISVWTGLNVAQLSFHYNKELGRILEKVKVVNENMIFETDSFGFKKTDFPNIEGSKAIMFLGDSFTEGLHVLSWKTFSNIFGVMLLKNGFQAIPVNTGVSGYGGLEMAWMLENYSKYFDVKMVIANLFPNDVHANFLAVIKGEYNEEKSYKEMFAYLKKMKDFCIANNIKLVISVIPPREQLTKIPVEGLFQKRVSEFCNIEKITFLNPLEYFRKIGENSIYLSYDPHFSDSGHEYYASFLFNSLQKEIESIKP